MGRRMSTPFISLTATHNPHRWYLPLEDSLCVGPPQRSFMFGGVGLAAAIQAMERTCKRPVIWATAQYLSFARPPPLGPPPKTPPPRGGGARGGPLPRRRPPRRSLARRRRRPAQPYR